ncbi:MAG: mechanosensitive ion channel family protein [Dehalococcoidia bacterium]|nr:mechanosensitive ion channel family protein [Dehalococcoidia bacterium]
MDWLIQHGTRIAIILALAVLFYFLLKKTAPPAVKKSLEQTMKGQPQVEVEKRCSTLTSLILTSGSAIIAVVTLFLILAQVGINIAALVAGFGILGITVAFAAQSTVKDLIAGFVITMENQYNVGDVVKIAEITGLVEGVNLRRTLLRDLDGILHVVPNGEIRTTSNFTKAWSRANLDISVAYKEDLDRVMSVLKRTWEELAEDPNWGPLMISKTPTVLRVNDFGDSGIIIKVVGETQPIQQWNIMGEFRRRIKRTFDEEGIEIPWPHTKLYFGNQLLSSIPDSHGSEKPLPGAGTTGGSLDKAPNS